METTKLVFVYNADSGWVSGLVDWVHKIVSPDTYACSLCAVTYNNWGMRSEWREFVRRLPAPVLFLHRDELAKHYGKGDEPLPAVFVEQVGKLHVLLDAHQMRKVTSLAELKSLVEAHIALIPGLAHSRQTEAG